MNKNRKDTSWGRVAGWYNDLLNGDDNYQSKVILPNIIRFLNLKNGEKVLDLACGQGYFSNVFSKLGASVIASDISKNLIEIAKKNSKEKISFYISPAHNLGFLKNNSIDTIIIILAIQNISNIEEVLMECNRVLKNTGRIVFVLNHPAFRIPQGSDWYFKDGVQSRLVSKYLSESKISIDMTPGESNPKKKIKTITFHRSLQSFMKVFYKNNLALTRLEEWISHKKSGSGPRKIAEDNARKEIPMFMCIEVKRSNF